MYRRFAKSHIAEEKNYLKQVDGAADDKEEVLPDCDIRLAGTVSNSL